MTEPGSSAPADSTLPRLAGSWRGSNGFRLMPADDLHTAPATAVVTTAAGGHATVVTYTWEHPQDGPQSGVLLVGSPDEHHSVTAAWADSWHQQPSILTMPGTLADGRLAVTADYGGGWRWTISVEGEDPLLLTMYNVVPDDQATDGVEAGPYPVMVAKFHRET